MYAVAVGEHSRTLFPRNVENTMKVGPRGRGQRPLFHYDVRVLALEADLIVDAGSAKREGCGDACSETAREPRAERVCVQDFEEGHVHTHADAQSDRVGITQRLESLKSFEVHNNIGDGQRSSANANTVELRIRNEPST